MLQSSLPGCLIPAYVPITDSQWWDWLQQIKNTYPSTPVAVIIKPSGGPAGAGTSSNPSWTTRITSLRSAGIIVLGYVDAPVSAGQATIEQRITDWRNLYGAVDGIFLDNIGVTAADQTLYTNIANYAKTTRSFLTVAANAKTAATTIETTWHSQTVPIDTFVLYDSAGLDAVDSTYTKYQTAGVNKNQLAYFGHTVPQIDQTWTSSIAQYVGWIFITSDTNYDTFPSYLGHFIRLLDNIRAGRLTGSTAQDSFGIDKIYHDKPGGTVIYMNRDDIHAGPTVENIDGEGVTKLANGHHRGTGGSNADLRVEHWSPELPNDTDRLNARFLNIEITVYSRTQSVSGSPPFAFQLYSRGGHHGVPTPCEGRAYKGRFDRTANEIMFVKEICHSSYTNNRSVSNGGLASGHSFGDGDWYGGKLIIYNIEESGVTYPKLEIWVDPNCTGPNGELVPGNNWSLRGSTVDRGDWFSDSGSYGTDCDGCAQERNEIFIDPGGRFTSGYPHFHCNMFAYRTDDLTSDFDYLSGREIDPSKPVATTPDPGGQPQNPTPPAPPGSTGGGGGTPEPEPEPDPGFDIFNVKEIYPTKTNGDEFFMNRSNVKSNLNRFNPKILSDTNLIRNADGSWKVTQTAAPVSMQVYQKNGYNPVTAGNAALNQQVMHSRGYMQGPDDFRNIEATIYVKLQSTPAPDDFYWVARGGEHERSLPNCEGCALRAHFGTNASTQMQKEQWHVATSVEPRKNVLGVSIIGKWVGLKFIVINKTINGILVTSQQLWCDIDNTNSWQKIDERTDAGGWGNQGFQCGGVSDQLISWGGPMVQFGWQTFSEVDFDKLSVREINPAAVPSVGAPPDNTGSCAGV